MRKIRFYYWIITSFALKHKKIIIPAAVFGALTFTQLNFFLSLIPKPKPTTYIGRIGVYTLSNLPKDIQLQTSRGLTSIDSNGQPIPDIAQSWTVSPDGKTYTFTLFDNIYWHNHDQVTSADINYTISDVEIERSDNHTLIFKLNEPFAPFPTVVSQPLFKRIHQSNYQILKRSQILGMGNYRIRQVEYDGNYIESITLESDRDKKIYRFYDTEQNAVTAFKLAEIDVIEDISNPAELSHWSNVNISKETNYQRYAAIFFNTEDRNLVAKTVRQALTYAIPNKPESNRALGPISIKSWAYNPNVKPYDYSLEKARELAQTTNMEFELELTTTPTYAQLAEEIKTSWEQLGLTVKLKVVNLPDTQNYQALLIGQQIPLDPDQYILWHSTQPTNITHYQSPKVDKLLEDGRTQLDLQKRKELYLDFQRFLVEDTPAAFLFYLDTLTVTRT